MKRIRKLCSALLSAAILLWYASPPVYTLLNGTSVIGAEPIGSAPALTVSYGEPAVFVRESGDERLSERAGQTYRVRLFGILPIKTLRQLADGPKVAVSGNAIGIVLHTTGVSVVGFTAVRTGHGTAHPASDAGLKEGDTILAVNGTPVENSESFAELCKDDASLVLTCLRDGKMLTVTVIPAEDTDGVRRMGCWVRDSTSGIGTLSFVDPYTNRYAALGHGVSDIDTGILFSYGHGSIFSAAITGVQAGTGGDPGELIGVFETNENTAIGSLTVNTPLGVGGTLYSPCNGERYPIAAAEEVHSGDAEILSTVFGSEPQAYHVRVIRTDVQSAPEAKGVMIEVDDPALLERTGGIVQGMSGSPVLQDGKLIAVVTHVFLNDSRRGYCLYAEWMYRKLF